MPKVKARKRDFEPLSARLFVRFFGYVFLSVHFAENNAVKELKNINSNEISI